MVLELVLVLIEAMVMVLVRAMVLEWVLVLIEALVWELVLVSGLELIGAQMVVMLHCFPAV